MDKKRKITHKPIYLPTISHIIIVIFFITIFPQKGVDCQFAEGLQTLEKTSFWSDTLGGLFDLTDFYVGLISKNKFGPKVLKGLGIETDNITISQFNSIQIPDLSDSTQLKSTISELAKVTAGYIAHLAIGVVLFVALLVCAFAVCCCRSKGCFCGKTGKQQKKSSDKTVIVILFLLLLIVTVILFLDGFGLMVGTKVFTENFSKQNESGNTQLVDKVGTILDKSLQYIDFLRNDTILLLDRKKVIKQVDKVIKSVSSGILDSVTGSSGEFNKSLTDLLNSLKKLKTNLDKASPLLKTLKTSYGSLETSVSDIKTKADKALANCNTDKCLPANNTYPLLTVLRLTTLLPDLSNLQTKLNALLNGPLTDTILQGPDGLFNELTNQLVNVSGIVDSTLKDLENTLRGDLPFSSDTVTSNSLFTSINSILNKAGPILDIVGPIIASTIFMMVVMNIVGLLLVICCASKKPSIPEKIFVASGATSFPTGSIYALLAAILFIVSCPLYGEFCMDFSNGNQSIYFGIADNLIKDVLKQEINNVSFLEGLNLKLDYSKLNLVRSGIYGYCQNNQSLSNILFDFATVDRDLTDSFVKKYAEPLIDNAIPSNLNLSLSDLFTDATIKTINDTIGSISLIDLPSFNNFTDLNSTVFLPSSSDLIFLTNPAIGQVGAVDADLNTLINTDLPNLDTLATQTTATERELTVELNSIDDTLQGSNSLSVQLTTFLDNLVSLRDNLTADGGDISKVKASALRTIRDNLFELAMEYKATFQNSFLCKPLYDILILTISLPCKSLLRPLNAMWLTLGTFSLLVIPSVGLGLFMGGLLVRQKNKENDKEENENRERDNREMDNREMDNRQRDNRQRDNRQRDNRQRDNRQRDNRQMDNRRNARRSGMPDRVYPASTPLPAPPPEYAPPFSPNNQPTGVYPPLSLFPNGVYNDMPRVQASNLPRQPFNRVRDSSAYNYAPINSRLPLYDPFTNYQRN